MPTGGHETRFRAGWESRTTLALGELAWSPQAASTPGDDFLTGTSGVDLLSGAGGNDVISGLGGNDELNGDQGDDRLLGGLGDDRLDGGAGRDTADYQAASAGVTVRLDEDGVAQAIGADQGIDTLFGIENLVGSSFSDRLTGSAAKNSFDLTAGGNDRVSGGDGDDTFVLGAAFTSADQIEGGLGLQDTLLLDGDYSGGIKLGFNTLRGVEILRLAAGFDYTLTATSRIADNMRMLVDGSALGAGDSLVFHGGKILTGNLKLVGGGGDDILEGGIGDDVFDLSLGGNDTVRCGNGYDVLYFGGAFTKADKVFGSQGGETLLVLDGDYDIAIGRNVQNVSELVLTPGGAYRIALEATSMLRSVTWTSMVGLGWGGGQPSSLYLDGSKSVDSLYLVGLEGNDTLIGGAGNDSLNGDYYRGGDSSDDVVFGGGGNDYLDGGGGHNILCGGEGSDAYAYSYITDGFDVYMFQSALDSTSKDRDYIGNLDIDRHLIDVPIEVSGIDSTVAGHIRPASFDADLSQWASTLQAHHAMFVSDTSINPGWYLLVDFNGQPGYQAGEDLVIAITNVIGTLGTSDFI